MLAGPILGGRSPCAVARSASFTPVAQPSVGVARPAPVASLSSSKVCPSLSACTTRRRLCVAKSVFSKFSDDAIRIVVLAQQQAKWAGFEEVGTEHVLLGVIANENERPGLFGPAVQMARAKDTVHRVSGLRKESNGSRKEAPPFTRNARLIFEGARTESQVMGMHTVTPEHICLAICNSRNTGSIRVLQALAIDSELVRREAKRRIQQMREADAKKSVTKVGRRPGKPAYKQFCRDLTELAKNQNVDPVIGRTSELARVCQILSRRKKNNPLLLGEPGVGKTAIAEGLAYIIAKRIPITGAPLPPHLQGAKVLQLDIALLLAGAKERGELEARLTKIIAEVSASEIPIILFIDELHTAVATGAPISAGGKSAGGPDISALMRPALARGDLRCMAASTTQEYRRRIEADTGLARCFQPIEIREPLAPEATAVLQGLVGRYEAHHKVAYTREAVDAAVMLTERHIPDRRLPDKAIDVLDEAGSRARIATDLARCGEADIHAHHRQIELSQVVAAKEEAAEEGRYEEASLLRDRELDLKALLVAPADHAPRIALVDTPDIEAVVSTWTGIPIERLSRSEAQTLAGLKDTLSQCIIGQDAALAAVAKAVQRARTGMKDPKRPPAALLFAGPSGVGKTSLCMNLAEQLFCSRESFIRIDMSECMERHAISKLIGAPPGYRGYGDGGSLTEAVRRNPHCLVLFDEIEKAHPDIFNMLLQVMEDGRLTDSAGKVVSFKQALIILTSNVGSHLVAKGANSLGFDLAHGEEGEGSAERLRTLVLDEMKGHFRPEFLNRLDDIVVFNTLSVDSLHKIAANMLAEVVQRVAAAGVHLRVSSAIPEFVSSAARSEEASGSSASRSDVDKQGARGLRRIICSLLEDPLTELLLESGCLDVGSSSGSESDVGVERGDRGVRAFVEADIVDGEIQLQFYDGSEDDLGSTHHTEQGMSIKDLPWIGNGGMLRKALERVNV